MLIQKKKGEQKEMPRKNQKSASTHHNSKLTVIRFYVLNIYNNKL